MGIIERVKSFFEPAPVHNIKVGDLVTCTCHGGIAIVLGLYDAPLQSDHPSMNMARIWWIKSSGLGRMRVWMHTIGRLNKYGNHWPS